MAVFIQNQSLAGIQGWRKAPSVARMLKYTPYIIERDNYSRGRYKIFSLRIDSGYPPPPRQFWFEMNIPISSRYGTANWAVYYGICDTEDMSVTWDRVEPEAITGFHGISNFILEQSGAWLYLYAYLPANPIASSTTCNVIAWQDYSQFTPSDVVTAVNRTLETSYSGIGDIINSAAVMFAVSRNDTLRLLFEHGLASELLKGAEGAATQTISFGATLPLNTSVDSGLLRDGLCYIDKVDVTLSITDGMSSVSMTVGEITISTQKEYAYVCEFLALSESVRVNRFSDKVNFVCKASGNNNPRINVEATIRYWE
jgi:hypothetical protein